MATPVKVDLGAFAQGEVPPPLVVTYTDFDSNPVDLTGFAGLQTNIQEEIGNNQNPLGTGTTVLTDAVGGEVTYTWVRDDMNDIGEYEMQVWVDNGTNYYASDLYTYSVYDGPEAPPV